MCDYFDNVFSCSGQRPQQTYQSAVTSDHRDVPQLPVDCTNMADGDYKDPTSDCSQKYYSCSGGVASERLCGDGLYFDYEFGRCENHDDIPACSGNARPYPAPTQAPGIIKEYPFDCSKLGDGNHAAGACESYFWICTGGSTNIEYCVNGLKYDEGANLCESEDKVPSCGGSRTVAPPSDQQTYNDHRPDPVFPIDCSKLADGSYADPTNACSHIYYMCSNGRASEFKCAAALKFDATTSLCLLKVHVPACKPQPSTYQDTYQQPARKTHHKRKHGNRTPAPATPLPPVVPDHDQDTYQSVTRSPPKDQTYQKRTLAPVPPMDPRDTYAQPTPAILPPRDQDSYHPRPRVPLPPRDQNGSYKQRPRGTQGPPKDQNSYNVYARY